MNRYPTVTCDRCGTTYNPIKNNKERPECPGFKCGAPVGAYKDEEPVKIVVDDVESTPEPEVEAADEPDEPEDE